ISVFVPEPIELGLVGRPVVDDETISRDVRFARLDLPITDQRRRVAEKWLIRMDSHRLRRAKVARMVEDRDARELAIDPSAYVTPPRASAVPVIAVPALRREKSTVDFAEPLAMSPKPNPSVAVFGQLERAGSH